MISFKEFLLEMVGHRPQIIRSKTQLEDLTKNSTYGEAKILINHDNGRMHAWDAAHGDHVDQYHRIHKRGHPSKVSAGTVIHDASDKKFKAEHSDEWSSLADEPGVKLGSAKDFHGHEHLSGMEKV